VIVKFVRDMLHCTRHRLRIWILRILKIHEFVQILKCHCDELCEIGKLSQHANLQIKPEESSIIVLFRELTNFFLLNG